LTSDFIGNIPAKNYQNRLMYDEVIASQSIFGFETQCRLFADASATAEAVQEVA